MTQPPSVRLVPLRVPGGWKVDHNSFFAIDGANQSSQNIAAYLVQDLLYIHSSGTDQSEAEIVHLDLGWYPDSDPSGRYQLSIAKGDDDRFDGPFLSISYEEVALRIENWLETHQNNLNQSNNRLNLVPLRIASGWSVQVNIFAFEQSSDRSYDDNKLLVLSKSHPENDPILISLIEHYDCSDKWYILEITRSKREIPIKVVNTQEKEQVIAIIEQWMEVAHRIGVSNPRSEILAPDYC